MHLTDAQRPSRCRHCNGTIEALQRFCGWCGSTVPPDSALATGSTAERKQVTILFADVVGSTAMLDGFDPERSADILDPVLSDIATIVSAHSGLVGAAAGDGLKALFGAPVAAKEHAERGCRAALQIREMARRRRVLLRIGLHSGEVVVRHLRPDVFADLDGVGLAVHVAARMEQAARPGTILISAATAALVDRRVSTRRRGPITIKGLRLPLEAFELVGPARKPGRSGGAERRGTIPFVGRDAELAGLVSGITGGDGIITISGAAGAGKSRLLSELLRRRTFAAWTVLRVEVEVEDYRVSLQPFIRMLRVLLEAGAHDKSSDLAARLDARLTTLAGISATDVDALRRLLGLRPTIATASYQPGLIMRSLHRVLIALAAQRPVLLAVEDVHWLDEDGIKFLNLVGERKHDGLVLLQTLRTVPRGLTALGRQLALPCLSDAAARTLLDTTMGEGGTSGERKRLILERADGIPLFLVELAKHASGSEDQSVPGTVQAVIGERMDRLPARCRELLRVASVIGRQAPFALIGSILSLTDEGLESVFEQLEDEQFLHGDHGVDGRVLVFDHILTREVAYATMVTATRRQLHRAALHAYENLYAGRLDDLAETLGAHAMAAGDWDRATTYLQRAAEKAIEQSAHSRANAFVMEALRALSQADWPADVKQRRELDIRLLLRVAYNAVGNYRERLANLDRAETLASRLGITASLPSLWISRASVMLQLGRVDDAIRLCTKARHRAAGTGDVATEMISGYVLSRNYFYAGRLAASLASATRSLALMATQTRGDRHGGGFGSSEVMLHTQHAQSHACRGQFAQARQSALLAVALAARKDRAFDAALAAYGLGVVDFYQGNAAGSLATLEEGFRASSADGAQSVYAALAGMLSYAFFRAGRHADALGLCRDAMSHAENSLYFANWPLLFGTLLLASSGDTDSAIRHAQTVGKRARKGGYPIQVVWSSLALGHLFRATNQHAARRHLDCALSESSRMGLRPCAARALFELGNLQQTRGDRDGARAFWRKGRRLAGSIGLRLDGDAPFFAPEAIGSAP